MGLKLNSGSTGKWIFPDNVPPEGFDLEIAGAKEIQSKNNPEQMIPVLEMLGNVNGVIDEYAVSVWRLKYDAVIRAWGDDTDKWINKKVHLRLAGSRIEITPLEVK